MVIHMFWQSLGKVVTIKSEVFPWKDFQTLTAITWHILGYYTSHFVELCWRQVHLCSQMKYGRVTWQTLDLLPFCQELFMFRALTFHLDKMKIIHLELSDWFIGAHYQGLYPHWHNPPLILPPWTQSSGGNGSAASFQVPWVLIS